MCWRRGEGCGVVVEVGRPRSCLIEDALEVEVEGHTVDEHEYVESEEEESEEEEDEEGCLRFSPLPKRISAETQSVREQEQQIKTPEE